MDFTISSVEYASALESVNQSEEVQVKLGHETKKITGHMLQIQQPGRQSYSFKRSEA